MANTKIPVELSSTPGIVDNSNATAITIDSSENVGIGTTSPTSFDAAGDNLVVGTGSGNNGMTVYSGTANAGSLFFADGTSTAAEKADGYIQYTHSNQALAFATSGGNEAMRIDSSGNLMVGKTSSGLANAGIEATASNILRTTKANSASAEFNRTGTDGDIAIFWKDTSPVGSIGATTGVLTIGNNNSGGIIFGYSGSHTFIEPSNTSGASVDDGATLGSGSKRFRDLYLSGGAYLGGTAAANKLDDYEEGTWTPAQGSFDTWTSPTFTATYTKVGRLVNIELRQTGGTIGWSAGDNMTGLPFAPAKGSIGYASDTGPVSDNGPILAWTNSAIYFNFAQGSEVNLVLNIIYETTA